MNNNYICKEIMKKVIKRESNERGGKLHVK